MKIWTDGSCNHLTGIGGWAWAVSETLWKSGHVEDTTNQRMELQAVIEALEWARENGKNPVTIVTDSAYVMNCFTQGWWHGWTNKGVKIKTGNIVKNWDLWSRLIPLATQKGVEFEKVKGHSGDFMNDFVDFLAKKAASLVTK